METLRINSKASRMSFSDVVITSFEVRTMSVDSLWAPVSAVPLFAEEVKESIKEKGLMNPIIVVRLPREDIERHFKQMKHARKKPPQLAAPDTPVVNVIWGGTNRLAAVKELGYTHVDCVIIPDFHTAILIQDRQRSFYKESKSDGVACQ